MLNLCDLHMGAEMWETGFQRWKEDLDSKDLVGVPYPRHLIIMSLGILISLGGMLSFRYPFMYAQEATGMCQLLETTGDLELLITIVLPGDMSRLELDIRLNIMEIQ